jgi:hypothetical protein
VQFLSSFMYMTTFLQIRIIWLSPFLLVSLLFLTLALLLWLRILALYQIRVGRVDTTVGFSPLNMNVGYKFVFTTFLMLRTVPSLLSFFWIFIMKDAEFCQRLFFHLLMWLCGLCPLFYLYAVLKLNHPCIPGLNLIMVYVIYNVLLT